MQIAYLSVRGRNIPRVMGGLYIVQKENTRIFRPTNPPWYRICTKAMVISRGSYGHGEFINVLTESVQIPYLPVRVHKLPRFLGGSIGHRMEICGTSGLPIPMVPCLHQSNSYMKRKLRAFRGQKCIFLVGADTVLTSAGPQTTPCHGG